MTLISCVTAGLGSRLSDYVPAVTSDPLPNLCVITVDNLEGDVR